MSYVRYRKTSYRRWKDAVCLLGSWRYCQRLQLSFKCFGDFLTYLAKFFLTIIEFSLLDFSIFLQGKMKRKQGNYSFVTIRRVIFKLTSWKLWVTSCELLFTSWKFKKITLGVAGCVLWVENNNFILWVASCFLRVECLRW